MLIAAAQAVAAPADAPGSSPNEIVVTGERVKRALRDTQSSVVVAKQRDIEAASADRVEQILALVPNVQLGNGSQGPAIRGQDTTGALQALPAFMGGNRPRTTLIVDGRRDTYNEFVFGTAPTWDVDRIEVFRSPQTTTQGQNSIAGAIFVYSNDPTFEPEYRARLIGGDLKTREVSAVASGPLSGDLALRVSGDFRYSRTTAKIADIVEHADPNHDVFGLARAKLLAKPRGLPGSKFELTYTHTQSQSPQIVGLTPPFRKRRDEGGGYGVMQVGVDALTATAHQPLAADLVADIVATAGTSNFHRRAPLGLGQAQTRGHDWSVEAVINWSPQGPLRAVGGVSRDHLAQRQFIDLSLFSGLGRFHDVKDSMGIFGEASLIIAGRVILTAGLRYQQDRQDRSGAFVAGETGIPLDFDRTFHAWLPKLSLAYDFSAAVRAGLLVQRAYNPGGTTLRFDTGLPDNFGAETLWDYEAFARTSFAGGRLTAAANLFYYAMRDSQRAKDIFVHIPGTPFDVGFADLFNAPRAHSYGAEAELDWRPNQTLSARLAVGLLRDRIDRSLRGYLEFEGKKFQRSPPLTATAAVDWVATPRARVSAQARYHGPYGDDFESPGATISAATIIDARAEYRLGPVVAFVYARNLFDKFALIDRFENSSATAEDPRTVGVGIETRF
jgi:outer membrane receptor protein involved in Fe transport